MVAAGFTAEGEYLAYGLTEPNGWEEAKEYQVKDKGECGGHGHVHMPFLVSWSCLLRDSCMAMCTARHGARVTLRLML